MKSPFLLTISLLRACPDIYYDDAIADMELSVFDQEK